MCKRCQYCLESCYWYLIEERFCYDESIALYEEPNKTEESYKVFDNSAFYDKVALIAGRSIVTIDPLPNPPVDKQPARRLRWWEDNVEEQNKKNEEKRVHEAVTDQNRENHKCDAIQTISGQEVSDDYNASIAKSTASGVSKSFLGSEIPLRSRLKSLHERRVSRSLTLNLDNLDKNAMELPVIRQASMPRFYLETPEENQKECSIATGSSTVLMSPVIPRSHELFDLRSVVQMDKEQRVQGNVQNSVPVHNPSSSVRLAAIREKLKPLKIKRQTSTPSLPGTIQHM